jgi:hypothetical protein
MDPHYRLPRVHPCYLNFSQKDYQMIRFLVPAIAALAVAFTPTDAHAYWIKGSVDCPDVVVEDANKSFQLANKFWLLGYITARNYDEDADVAKEVEDDVIYGMMLAYCKNNPSSDMDDAAIRVYEILSNL